MKASTMAARLAMGVLPSSLAARRRLGGLEGLELGEEGAELEEFEKFSQADCKMSSICCVWQKTRALWPAAAQADRTRSATRSFPERQGSP